MADTRGEHWTLATAVWDHRLAAAETLRELRAGARGVPLLQQHLSDALAQRHVNDSLYKLQLLVALGAPQARAALAQVQARFADHPGMMAALEPLAEQMEKVNPRQGRRRHPDHAPVLLRGRCACSGAAPGRSCGARCHRQADAPGQPAVSEIRVNVWRAEARKA